MSILHSFLTPWRLKWYPIAILLGIFISIFVVFLTGEGPQIISGRLGGDFTAYYAAGRMVRDEGFSNLYDFQRQHDSQKDLYPDHEGVLPFSYPPYVALACIPLSIFSYRTAFALHLMISLSSLFLGFFLLRKIIHKLDDLFLPVVVLSITFYPFLKAILNGQLTAIIFLCYASAWRLTKDEKHFLCGIPIASLIFKPQFMIPLLGVYFLSGRIKTVISTCLLATALITASLIFTGLDPYISWYEFTRWFIPADAVVNKYNAVSWIGFFDAIFGVDNRASFLTGYSFSLCTILLISYVWFKGGKSANFDSQMGLAAVSFILIPPHVMYYDAALIVISFLVFIPKIKRYSIELISVCWLISFMQIFAEKNGFSPIFFLVLFTFFFSLKKLFISATTILTAVVQKK